MNTDTLPTPSKETPALPANGTPGALTAAQPTGPTPVPEIWKPLFAELTTYYRHLRALLSEGEDGRYVVIQGEELCCTWDTYRDASQYGRERFGDQLSMIHRVDPRDVERLAQFFPATETSCPG